MTAAMELTDRSVPIASGYGRRRVQPVSGVYDECADTGESTRMRLHLSHIYTISVACYSNPPLLTVMDTPVILPCSLNHASHAPLAPHAPHAPLQRCGTPSSSAALLSSFLHRMRRKGALAGLEADPIVGLPAAAASDALPATDGSPTPSVLPVAVLPGSAAQAALGPLVRWVTGQELLAEMLDQVGQCCNELNPNSFLGASSLYRFVFVSCMPVPITPLHSECRDSNSTLQFPHFSHVILLARSSSSVSIGPGIGRSAPPVALTPALGRCLARAGGQAWSMPPWESCRCVVSPWP